MESRKEMDAEFRIELLEQISTSWRLKRARERLQKVGKNKIVVRG